LASPRTIIIHRCRSGAWATRRPRSARGGAAGDGSAESARAPQLFDRPRAAGAAPDVRGASPLSRSIPRRPQPDPIRGFHPDAPRRPRRAPHRARAGAARGGRGRAPRRLRRAQVAGAGGARPLPLRRAAPGAARPADAPDRLVDWDSAIRWRRWSARGRRTSSSAIR
jgi:hypothetical protein